MKPRFTRDGSDALEQQLADICHDVAGRLRELLPAGVLLGIALGGGYGRGEGGVLRTGGMDHPYNDVEFFVLVKGPLWLRQRDWGQALAETAHRLTEDHGIEIEFKLLTPGKLRRSGPAMFYYDLMMGHRWAMGDEALLAGCAHHRDASTIPLHEATRLLMNRSSGLLFAWERLCRPGFTADDADFTARNIAKAQLALGDVWLAAHGQYHWSCLERHRRLGGLPAPWDLIGDHAAGVEFKLHPRRSTAPRGQLQATHKELTEAARKLFLWLESRRLGTAFATTADYAASPLNKCPEVSLLRRWLINARESGAEALRQRPRYPREQLLHGLCGLLWDQSQPLFPAAQLRSYEQTWHRFN